jgi:hypothetical protein
MHLTGRRFSCGMDICSLCHEDIHMASFSVNQKIEKIMVFGKIINPFRRRQL